MLENAWDSIHERRSASIDLPDAKTVLEKVRNGGLRGLVEFAIKDFGLDFVLEAGKRALRAIGGRK